MLAHLKQAMGGMATHYMPLSFVILLNLNWVHEKFMSNHMLTSPFGELQCCELEKYKTTKFVAKI